MSKQLLEKKLTSDLNAGKNLFVPYIVAGDGGYERLKKTITFLEDTGVSAIELGIPFSDPVADGPTIQVAGRRALNAGISLRGVLDFLADFTERSVPIVLMTYINPIYAYGVKEFAKKCRAVNVSGIIVPDVPMEEEALIADALSEHDIAFIRLAALTSTPERIEEIARRSEGFLYAVSVTGTTGARRAHEKRVYDYLRTLKAKSNVPVLAGFGVSNPEQAKTLGEACDGVIVGSKIVELLGDDNFDAIQTLIEESMQGKALER